MGCTATKEDTAASERRGAPEKGLPHTRDLSSPLGDTDYEQQQQQHHLMDHGEQPESKPCVNPMAAGISDATSEGNHSAGSSGGCGIHLVGIAPNKPHHRSGAIHKGAHHDEAESAASSGSGDAWSGSGRGGCTASTGRSISAQSLFPLPTSASSSTTGTAPSSRRSNSSGNVRLRAQHMGSSSSNSIGGQPATAGIPRFLHPTQGPGSPPTNRHSRDLPPPLLGADTLSVGSDGVDTAPPRESPLAMPWCVMDDQNSVSIGGGGVERGSSMMNVSCSSGGFGMLDEHSETKSQSEYFMADLTGSLSVVSERRKDVLRCLSSSRGGHHSSPAATGSSFHVPGFGFSQDVASEDVSTCVGDDDERAEQERLLMMEDP